MKHYIIIDELARRERIAIYAVIDASQRAKREAVLMEIAALKRSLSWYEGALAMARQAELYVPRVRQPWRLKKKLKMKGLRKVKV